MTHDELKQEIMVMADKITYAMDNGVEDNQVNDLLGMIAAEVEDAINNVISSAEFNGFDTGYGFNLAKEMAIKAIRQRLMGDE